LLAGCCQSITLSLSLSLSPTPSPSPSPSPLAAVSLPLYVFSRVKSSALGTRKENGLGGLGRLASPFSLALSLPACARLRPTTKSGERLRLPYQAGPVPSGARGPIPRAARAAARTPRARKSPGIRRPYPFASRPNEKYDAPGPTPSRGMLSGTWAPLKRAATTFPVVPDRSRTPAAYSTPRRPPLLSLVHEILTSEAGTLLLPPPPHATAIPSPVVPWARIFVYRAAPLLFYARTINFGRTSENPRHSSFHRACFIYVSKAESRRLLLPAALFLSLLRFTMARPIRKEL
jgi:hypothetical protein